MNNVVVTGGCGYIGAQTIVELLRHTHYNVISIDNFSNSTAESIERIRRITGKTIINYSVDLCSLPELEGVFGEIGSIVGVIHFAALKSVPESVMDPIMYYKNNLESLLNIIKCCDLYSVRNFIFSSSCSVYGNVDSLPVAEKTPLGELLSPYAHTKLIGEEIIGRASARLDMSFVLLRYFNPAGADISGLIGELPNQIPTTLVPVICQTGGGQRAKMCIFGGTHETPDGTCVRDYVHVVDVALAHIAALDFLVAGKNDDRCSLFNLGSGTGISVLEAIASFERVSGVSIKYEITTRREGDVSAIYSDSSLAQRVLGWSPKYAIDEVMASAWKWHRHIFK